MKSESRQKFRKKMRTFQNEIKMITQYMQIQGKNEDYPKRIIHASKSLHKKIKRYYVSNLITYLEYLEQKEKLYKTQKEQTLRNNQILGQNQ